MSALQQMFIPEANPPNFKCADYSSRVFAEQWVLKSTNISDLPDLQNYYEAMSLESRRFRLQASMSVVPISVLQLYSGANLPLVAGFTLCRSIYDSVIIGEGILARSTDSREVELGVSIADSMSGHGWGKLLITQLISRAVQSGYESLHADTLWNNARFIAIASSLGFSRKRHPDDCNLVRMTLALDPTAQQKISSAWLGKSARIVPTQ